MTFDPTTLPQEAQDYLNERVNAATTAKSTILGEKKTLQDQIDALGGFDTLKTLKEQADRAKQDADALRTSKLSVDERLTEQETAHALQLKTANDRAATLEARLAQRELEVKLNEAIATAEGNPLMLIPTLRERVETKLESDGSVTIKVKGKDGKFINDKGTPNTLDDLVGEYKADDAWGGAFKAPAVGGGGTRPGQGGTATGNRPEVTDRAARESHLARKYKLK
jgi:hypothetical protein